MRSKGKIASWEDDKGFGFIAPFDGGAQVFIHIKAFGRRDRRPTTGDVVTDLPFLVFVIYAIASLVTLSAYAIDKIAAQRGRWRTSEGTLHLFALLGGWPGALIAQQALRHKTVKKSFRLIFWVTVIVNIAVLVWLHTSGGQGSLDRLTGANHNFTLSTSQVYLLSLD